MREAETIGATAVKGDVVVADRTRWLSVWALFLAGCTLALHAGKVPSALPLLRAELGLSLTEAGSVVSTYAILIALGGVAAGLLVGTVGYARFAVLGVALGGVGSVLGAGTDALAPLLLTRAIEGGGWIVAVVALPALISALARPADRPLALGLWGAFVPLGAGLMLLVAPSLQALGGWRLSWLLAALASLLAAGVVAWVCRAESARLATVGAGEGGGRLRAALADLARPAAWLLGLSFFLYSFQFLAVTSFLPTLLVETAGFALGPASVLAALVILGNVVGNVAAGALLRRGVGHVPLLSGAALATGIAAAVVYHAPWPPSPRVAAAFAFSVIGGAIPGTLFATVPSVARSSAALGALVGLMLQCSGLGQWLGPLALPAVVEWRGSWSAAGLPTVLAGVLGVAAAFGLRRSRAER